ncbi:hypothetical protein [Streptomyces sp. NPDC007063]|uniref:hypothetical protein n=1 Tax=Streptomyces sp. NPDC007063 TaxID=3364772 RepID=UPI00369BC4A0
MESESLKASSRRWMGAALAAFAKGPTEHDFAVHHAAVAVEHLMKAYLSGLHPALIVDAAGKGGLDSLLHATGHGHLAQGSPVQTKTIGISKAREYVSGILREKFRIADKEFRPLADARNGVAHAAVCEAGGVQEALAIAMRSVDPLLTELELDPDEYWSPYRDLHDQLIDQHAKAVRVSLAAKLARARDVFAQRFGHLDERERSLVLQAGTRLYSEKPECRDCPACGVRHLLDGDVVIGTANGDDAVLFVPASFDCPVCGLELDGEEFQELADLAQPVVLDYDLSNYIYDEDWDTVRRR